MAESPLPLSKAAAAYASLRRKIQAGELAPGERVTLNKLAQMEGMSLTPIREALKRLVSEGYAVHDEHVGTRIADLTPARVEQIYRLRRVLEPMAVRLAAERADDETEHILEDLIRHAEAAATPQQRAETNEQFHFGLYRLSGDELLVGFIEQLWAGMPYPSQLIFRDPDGGRASLGEHRRIADAVSARDAETASAELERHIGHGFASAMSSFEL
ncbi:GntR family transcriptional regulator [Nesterenkonia sp. NBAIMH1]|uniref:GntR family transcriptional regulator n=1 Tax=Nesterenkonia sp. NBAIMH1 TaxID=2600320 RepID=UPI0011B400B9|nr:GntR family transcriptional regulator [Nesterenkonia sp. NBAIMH1]